MKLSDNERIDDLQYNSLKLIQYRDKFCFGTDAVELANFVTGGQSDSACDLGSGSGIIAVLLASKLKMKVTAVEIQACMAELIERNSALNGLEDMIKVLNIPLQKVPEYYGKGSFTVVVSNPPYRKEGSGQMQKSESIALSRHEIAVKFYEVADAAAYLLPTGGRFYTVNQTKRLSEILCECSARKLEPKVLQVLLPSKQKAPHLFMLKCIKEGKSGLEMPMPRVVNTFDIGG